MDASEPMMFNTRLTHLDSEASIARTLTFMRSPIPTTRRDKSTESWIKAQVCLILFQFQDT